MTKRLYSTSIQFRRRRVRKELRLMQKQLVADGGRMNIRMGSTPVRIGEVYCFAEVRLSGKFPSVYVKTELDGALLWYVGWLERGAMGYHTLWFDALPAAIAYYQMQV